jgi:hypothetical protein
MWPQHPALQRKLASVFRTDARMALYFITTARSVNAASGSALIVDHPN